MTKTKVCYLLNDFSIGGVSAVVYDTLNGMDLEKFDVAIILLSDDQEYLFSRNLDPRVTIFVCPFHFDPDYSLRRYIVLSLNHSITHKRGTLALDQIQQLDPDVLHLHVLPRELVIGILAKNNKPSLELVYTDHSLRIGENDSTFIKRSILAFSYGRLYKHYNVIAVSKSVRACHERYGWLSRTKVNHLLENRLDITLYEPKDYKKKKYIKVIYVTRLCEKKGLELLLEVWKDIRCSFLELVLVGDGALNTQLKEYVKRNLPNGTVTFTGFVSDVRPYLAEADIAVFTSEKEGLPISLLEKMAVGLPVIVNDIPELTDFIEDGVNGLVFNGARELVEKIEFLTNRADIRKQLGAQARETLKVRLGSKTLSELTEDYYSILRSQDEKTA